MGAPLRLAGLCVALLVTVVARAEAQAGGNLQEPAGTAGPFTATDGFRRYVNGHTDTSIDERLRMYNERRNSNKELEEHFDAKIEKGEDGTRLVVKDHSYLMSAGTGTRPAPGTVNGHTGGLWTEMGAATMEGQHHPYSAPQSADVAEQEQVSGSGGGQGEGESPDSSDTAGNKSSPAPSKAWTREAERWQYQEDEWRVVSLPDPAFSYLLPPSATPGQALVVAAVGKVEVARQVTVPANLTLQYVFFLLDTNQDPETSPELKVYQDVGGTRTLLQAETQQGQWFSRRVFVPQAENSSILFEGWLRSDGDVIALSDVSVESVPLSKDESLDDGDDQLTLTTETSQTVAAREDQTQDVLTPEDVPTVTNTQAQDDSIASDGPPVGVPLDQPSNSTADGPSSPAEGNVTVVDVAETPEAGAYTDTPRNETQATEQISGGVDSVAVSEDDERTSHDPESDSFNATATIGEEGDADEASTIISATDDETMAPKSISGPGQLTNGNTTLSIPGVTTDGLQANATTTNTSMSQDTTIPFMVPVKIEYNNETENTSETIVGGNESTPGMTPEGSQPNGISGNITSPSGVTVPLESTPVPSAGGNTTEAVSAEPVSSTSWQVFQVFMALCVLGLLALGFLYWKRRRRQDDEIPVFQRCTDYPNPAFSMEDAANFMSRAGRNTYKTID